MDLHPSEAELGAMAPRELLALGITQYNEGLFFEAHESWEQAWKGAPAPLRRFYQGLIQVAAAFVHQRRGEYPGTHRLLREGADKLEAYRPDFLGVWLDDFVEGARAAREHALSLGERRFRRFDVSRTPRLRVQDGGRQAVVGPAGARLACLEWEGDGGRTVVLLHAPGHLGRLWLPVAARLAPQARVLAPDLPGQGASPPASGAVLEALHAWAGTLQPGPALIAGVGPSGFLASALVGRLGARGVALAPDRATGPIDGAAARDRRRVWGSHWEMFTALSERPPWDGWRADLLWTYVEYGTRPLLDGRLELACHPDWEASLLEALAGEMAPEVIAESPLGNPVAAAKRLKEALQLPT